MDSTYADEKFARGEITNKQIVTTKRDWDAVEAGKVGTLEDQSPVSAWSGVTEQPDLPLSEAQIEAEERAREEAQGYVVNGEVAWTKVANDVVDQVEDRTAGITSKILGDSMLSLKPAPLPLPDDEKNKLFQEFEEFLEWKRSKGGRSL